MRESSNPPAVRRRLAIGAAVVLAQLGAVLAAHAGTGWGDDRYFAWAPNDYSVDYTVSATVNGRALDAQEIAGRYQVAQHGYYQDPPNRLTDHLARAESAHPGDRAELTVTYRVNGHPEQVWAWSHG